MEHLTANPALGVKARLLVQAFSGILQEVPSGYTQFLASLYFALSPTTEVVIVGDSNAPDTREMLSILKKTFNPHIVTLLKDPNVTPEKLITLAPFTANHTSINGKATAYVCRNYSCESPTTDAKQLLLLLNNKKPGQKG